MDALPAASGPPPSSVAVPMSACAGILGETGLGEAGPGEAWLGEAGERRLWRRAGWGGMGGNGGGTVGARRLLPTRRRGRARGVTGLPGPGGRGGFGGEERVLETWGGGMLGRAGAGRLVLRAMSSVGAAASRELLLTLGEAGLRGASDSVLSLVATEVGVGARAGAATGVGTAMVGRSSEAGLSLTLS